MFKVSTISTLIAGTLVVGFTAADGHASAFDQAGKKQPSFQRARLVSTTNKLRIDRVTTPRPAAGCASQVLKFSGSGGDVRAFACVKKDCKAAKLAAMGFHQGSQRVASSQVAIERKGTSQKDVEPVVGPDDLLYLCRENEREGVCECIPWFPPKG